MCPDFRCVAYFFINFAGIIPFHLSLMYSTFFLAGGVNLLWLAVISGPSFYVYIREARATDERIEAEEKFKASPDTYAALDLDAKRLNEYYTINQSQARSSFRWAIFSMVVGLGTIIAG